MDITLPNGQIINGVPEGTTKEQVRQKAIASGLATEADFGAPVEAPVQAEQSRNAGFTPTEVPEKKGFLQKVKDFAAGGAEGERNVFAAPELNEFWNKQLKEEGMSSIGFSEGDVKPWQILSGRAMKAGLGGLLTGDPAEIEQMIAANYPEAEFGLIGEQKAVRFPSGDYFLQPERIDPLDIARFGVDVAAFTPAGRVIGTGAKQLAKGAAVAGLTQTGMQATEAAVGGEFDPEDVAIEAAMQGGMQVGAPVVKAAAGKVKEAVSPLITKILSKFKTGESAAPYEDVAKALSTEKNIMPEILADPEVLKAADDLGINVNPSVYSTSDIYREMENGLKAMPGSKLSVNEKETVRELSKKADELIVEWAGTTDKSAISADFSERMLSTVKQMEDEASVLYQSFDDVIPKSLKIKPQSTIDFIEDQISVLGGIDNLDPKVAKIYRQITGGKGDVFARQEYKGMGLRQSADINPTYSLLDKLRRDIGSALKGQGPFKDASQNDLKSLYGTLTDDTLKGAELFGLGDEAAIAKDLVKRRKALEESLQGALGKDLSKSLMAELSAGVKQLQQGKTGQFNKVMNSIPAEDKQQVAISALNDIFAGSATKAKQFSLEGFVGSYDALQRNPRAASKLWDLVPPEAKARVDAIYKVSKGLVEANKKDLNNPSGSARAIISAMDAPNGIINKLFKVGGQMSAGAAATAPFDAGVTGAGFGLMNALRNSKTKATEAATDMLTSPGFQEAMNRYIKGDGAAANSVLNRLKSTSIWISEQPPEVKRAIIRQGLIQYLTSEGEE